VKQMRAYFKPPTRSSTEFLSPKSVERPFFFLAKWISSNSG